MIHIPQQTLEFLGSSAPFDLLTEDQLNHLASTITVCYISKGDAEQILEQQRGSLFLINSGQFSVKDSPEKTRHLSEEDYFGCGNVLHKEDHLITMTVDSPGLVYCIPAQTFEWCVSVQPGIGSFFRHYSAEKIHSEQLDDSTSIWMYKPVHEALAQEMISADLNSSILTGVRLMAKHCVSSLVITDNQRLAGIITDRDIRNRVVAEQVDVHQPLSSIMTTEPAKITHQRTLFDALCMMTEHNVNHLPIIDKDSEMPVGILTATDMIRHQRSNVLLLVKALSKASSMHELSRLSWQLPQYFSKHAKRLGDFDIAGKVLSQATDIMTRKLITFFVKEHGAAPMDYCWLVYGSQAREDQTMGSDQDNGLLLATEPDEKAAQYFADLAEYVCRGLDKCGIRLCTGNIMASNPLLRLSVNQAIKEAENWVQSPTPEAILNCNIFLDVRGVAGNIHLLTRLHQARAPLFKQTRFLAALTRHACKAMVPLSVFQKFSYKKGLPKKDCIDLKHSGVAIINDLVRVYSLANGLTMPAIPLRLESLMNQPELSSQNVKNLRDVWLLLNRLRWRHQTQNNAKDNYLSMSDLSSIEKYQLKEAFRVIRRTQQAALFKFAGGSA